MTFLERYLHAVDKCYVQCLNDPENEPYKSKYEARKLFEELYNVKEINDELDILKKQFENLDLIEENEGQLKFVINQSIKESSSKKKLS